MAASTCPNATTASLPHERQGIVFCKWPFRLDIDVEYQDWILVSVCVLLVGTWLSPCFCGRMRNRLARAFTSWVYTRLHVFFLIVTYGNLFVLMFTISVLPDWTVNEFLQRLVLFISWVLVHLQKLITSFAIIGTFFLLLRFRDRIALAAGLEHITVFRWSWRDALGFRSKKRPVEVYVWKVEGLQSASGKVMKPNDVFVECHMGYNEPMRTRVHNNAGTGCFIRESFQLNIDESSTGTLMTILVKDQGLIAGRELARLMLSTRELCGIEDQTGKRRVSFEYSEECFVPLGLAPCGKIWLAISPVDVVDEERALLMHEDALLSC